MGWISWWFTTGVWCEMVAGKMVGLVDGLQLVFDVRWLLVKKWLDWLMVYWFIFCVWCLMGPLSWYQYYHLQSGGLGAWLLRWWNRVQGCQGIYITYIYLYKQVQECQGIYITCIYLYKQVQGCQGIYITYIYLYEQVQGCQGIYITYIYKYKQVMWRYLYNVYRYLFI